MPNFVVGEGETVLGNGAGAEEKVQEGLGKGKGWCTKFLDQQYDFRSSLNRLVVSTLLLA